ncbi:MAG: oligopeptide/dipeptide ABC transporter ATP-binding protein [Bradymonadia bacterium]|jgi:oligopeptide/dipeptide ABC transporter ATP-binding protein
MTASPEPLLTARGIVKVFKSGSLLRGRTETRALDGVDIEIGVGEVVALIGESGSGKTTLGKIVLRLTTLTEGEVRFEGADLFAMGTRQLRDARRDFQMVFQNQRANLHPRMTVQQMLDESLRLHRPELDADSRAEQISELLRRVGLSERAEQRPDSLSGGERRRVGLARILATRPKLIVADEPTSGLDAAIKLQIIALLKDLKDAQLTYLLISHDLGLVRRIADRALVMLHGRIIEEVPASRLGDPAHPYTQRLMRAAHLLDDRRQRASNAEDGQTADASIAAGCVYADECPLARRRGILAQCRQSRPPYVQLGPGHRVACFAAGDESKES